MCHVGFQDWQQQSLCSMTSPKNYQGGPSPTSIVLNTALECGIYHNLYFVLGAHPYHLFMKLVTMIVGDYDSW